MTNAIPIRLADAVVSEINAHSFDIGSFRAVRSSGSWDDQFSELGDDFRVDVLYQKNSARITLHTHGSIRHAVDVVAVVRKRINAVDRDSQTGEINLAAVDELDTLVIDIAKLFISRRNTPPLTDEPDANYDPSEIRPMLGAESKLRKGLYYGLVKIPLTLTEAL